MKDIYSIYTIKYKDFLFWTGTNPGRDNTEELSEIPKPPY